MGEYCLRLRHSIHVLQTCVFIDLEHNIVRQLPTDDEAAVKTWIAEIVANMKNILTASIHLNRLGRPAVMYTIPGEFEYACAVLKVIGLAIGFNSSVAMQGGAPAHPWLSTVQACQDLAKEDQELHGVSIDFQEYHFENQTIPVALPRSPSYHPRSPSINYEEEPSMGEQTAAASCLFFQGNFSPYHRNGTMRLSYPKSPHPNKRARADSEEEDRMEGSSKASQVKWALLVPYKSTHDWRMTVLTMLAETKQILEQFLPLLSDPQKAVYADGRINANIDSTLDPAMTILEVLLERHRRKPKNNRKDFEEYELKCYITRLSTKWLITEKRGRAATQGKPIESLGIDQGTTIRRFKAIIRTYGIGESQVPNLSIYCNLVVDLLDIEYRCGGRQFVI
ncbi:hypothetical protein CPC08DRAFT_730491 [Agrocybe pediades]|nr:hypothetical protein CPC08DRAFT_730491 [Agrocybe pediades]